MNQEAKKNLNKQIKKATQREVSEPPPKNTGIIFNPSQLLNAENVANNYNVRHHEDKHNQKQRGKSIKANKLGV